MNKKTRQIASVLSSTVAGGRPRMLRILLSFSVILTLIPGCWGRSTGLPASVDLSLPDGTSVDAEQGRGVPSLANSRWEFFRTAEAAQEAAFVTLNFGPQGELLGFDENTIASEIFGPTIFIDGRRHNTTQTGLQYAAAAYGGQTQDGTGMAFEVRVTGFVAGIKGAEATATATATYDPATRDIVRGTFSFSTRVTLVSIEGANQNDSFSFVGQRVPQ